MLKQETSMYEVLARWTPEGLQGCHKIEVIRVIDDATTPPTVIAESLVPAVPITKEEAASILTAAVMVPQPAPDPALAAQTEPAG